MLRRNVELHVAEGHFCGLSAKGLHISEVLPLLDAHQYEGAQNLRRS